MGYNGALPLIIQIMIATDTSSIFFGMSAPHEVALIGATLLRLIRYAGAVFVS